MMGHHMSRAYRLIALMAFALAATGSGMAAAQNDTARWGVVVVEETLEGDRIFPFDDLIPIEWQVVTGSDLPRYEIRVTPRLAEVQSCEYTLTGNPHDEIIGTIVRQRLDIAITVTDFETGEEIAERTFSGDAPATCRNGIAFSYRGEVRYFQGSINLTDTEPWVLELRNILDLPGLFSGHRGRINTIAFSPDGRSILTASADGTARVWDRDSGEERLQIAVSAGQGIPVEHAAYSPDGLIILTQVRQQSTLLWQAWDAETGRALFSFSDGICFNRAALYVPHGNLTLLTEASCQPIINSALAVPVLVFPQGWMEIAVFNRDGNRLAVPSSYTIGPSPGESTYQPAVIIYNPDTGEVVTQLIGGNWPIYRVAYHPDGQRLLSISDTGSSQIAQLWNVVTGQEQYRVDLPGETVSAAAISPDGTTFFLLQANGILQLRDEAAGELLRRLAQPTGNGITAAAYSPDGRAIVLGGETGSGRIRDVTEIMTGIPPAG